MLPTGDLLPHQNAPLAPPWRPAPTRSDARRRRAPVAPLRNAVQWSRRRRNPGRRGPEHEIMRLVPPPDFDPALQGPQQPSRVGSRLFNLKPLKQLACGPPRLGLKPAMQLRRHRHERIRTTPATLGLLLGPAGRAHLALPPGHTQTRQELLQRRRGRRHHLAGNRTISDLYETLLASPDRVEGVVQNLPFLGHTGVRRPPVCEGRISTGRVSCAGGGWPPRGQARWG
jgi:hypothetical protein